jgi:5'-AMP-activated protein kinase regulatory gamma subunit
VNGDCSLHKAVQTLCEQKVHRLPVMERMTGNVSYILTHKRLIKFLYLYVSFLSRGGHLTGTERTKYTSQRVGKNLHCQQNGKRHVC